jgi:hypothetical protein
MGEGAAIPPRDITPRGQRHILITDYWRGSGAQEPHIGFGTAKGRIWLRLARIVEGSITGLLTRAHYESPGRPTWPVRYLAYVLTAVWKAIFAVSLRLSAAGFYELDDAGRPIRFLSHHPPDGLWDRSSRSTGRKGFLRQASS